MYRLWVKYWFSITLAWQKNDSYKICLWVCLFLLWWRKTIVIVLFAVRWFRNTLIVSGSVHILLCDFADVLLSAWRVLMGSSSADISDLDRTEGGTHPLQLLSSSDVLKHSVNLLLDASGPVHYPVETRHSLSQHVQKNVLRRCKICTLLSSTSVRGQNILIGTSWHQHARRESACWTPS